MHQNYAFVETWRGRFFMYNGRVWDGRCPGICCRGGQAMKTEIIRDWRWVFFWGRHAVQTEIPSKVWIYGRVVESTSPNLFHLFWWNLAVDFLISLLQTDFIMMMIDYDCGDGCHKSKWNMTLASSCTYTWCFWFWNKLISPSYIIFLDFQSSSTPRGVSRRQDKLQINTAPGDKAGGRQPQAAQVATAPPVVHKEPVSLGHQQDHMGCDWKLTWVPWWKAPMV